MKIEEALVARLLTGSPSYGARVYPVQAKQGATRPFITYKQVSEAPTHAMGSDPNVHSGRFQVSCWGDTYAAARIAANDAVAALSRYRAAVPLVHWTTVGDSNWTAQFGPTRTAAALTVAGIPLDLIGDADAAHESYFQRKVPWTTNGDKSLAFVIARSSAYAAHLISLTDPAVGNLIALTVDFRVAVPVVSMYAGTLISTVDLGGAYRLTLSTVGGTPVLAAHNNWLTIDPASSTDADEASLYMGDVYAWDVDGITVPGGPMEIFDVFADSRMDLPFDPEALLYHVAQDFLVMWAN